MVTQAPTAGHARADHLGDEPVTLVILGASGDLTHRLLLPGLGTLLKNEPDRTVRLVGAAMDPMEPADWTARVEEALREGGCLAPPRARSPKTPPTTSSTCSTTRPSGPSSTAWDRASSCSTSRSHRPLPHRFVCYLPR